MKQKRIAECKYNSLAPYSGKEANGKIEYGKNLMKHRKIYLAVSIGCLFMAAIYYQIESHFLINRNPFFYNPTQYIKFSEAYFIFFWIFVLTEPCLYTDSYVIFLALALAYIFKRHKAE